MSALAPLAQEVVGRLAWTSLQAALLVGAVWLLNRHLPRLSAATRSLLWWLLGVQLLLGLLLPTPVSIPLLTPAPARTTFVASNTVAPAEHQIVGFGQGRSTSSESAGVTIEPVSAPAATEASSWSRWWSALFALWLAGVIVQSIATWRHWREARSVVRASRPLDDAALQAVCVEQARALGLRRCPSLRVSDAIRSPQVSGVWRPVVLLPADQNLSSDESALALAHELTHLHRGDLWMGWIPGIAQRLFFFHPMVSWAMREYALNREAACDAQVVQQHDAAPQDYGRLLLRLGVAHPLHAGLAGASPTFHNLKRRLTMLQLSDQGTTSRLRSALLVVLVAAIGVLPYRVTEAKADAPAAASSTSSTWTIAPTPPTPPAAPVQPAQQPTGMSVTPPMPAMPAMHATPSAKAVPAVPAPPAPPAPKAPQPLPPTPAVPAPPPPPPPPPHDSDMSGFIANDIDVSTRSTDIQYGFALLSKDSVIVNGSKEDLAQAKRLRGESQPLVMFRRDNNAYVIRDQAYVARARAAYAATTQLSEQQGELSGEEGRISGEESGIGAREAALGQRLASIGEREAALAEREAQQPTLLSGQGERASFAAERAEIALEQKSLQLEQRRLSEEQRQLSEKQRELSHRQEAASSDAVKQMSHLLDEALAKGVAQPISNR